jgi:hypothetical protein
VAGSVVKRTSHDEQSRPEIAAQAWHDGRHPEGWRGTCWCCCPDCPATNPHHAAAMGAALRDIAARIEESVASQRPPPREGQRLPD